MSYLLDTNVISELRKSATTTDPNVRAWAQQPPTSELVLIAATARTHNLVVVTRNVADFRRLEVELLNPWNG